MARVFLTTLVEVIRDVSRRMYGFPVVRPHRAHDRELALSSHNWRDAQGLAQAHQMVIERGTTNAAPSLLLS
jgi:hypothetical protein